MKKIYVKAVSIYLAMVLVCTSCSYQKEDSSQEKYDLFDIVKVKQTCNEDLENAKKGKFNNLSFDDIEIYTEFPEKIESFEGKFSYPSLSKDEMKKTIQQQVKECKQTLGEGIKDESIMIELCNNNSTERKVYYKDLLDELEKKASDNEKYNYGYIFYNENDEDENSEEIDTNKKISLHYFDNYYHSHSSILYDTITEGEKEEIEKLENSSNDNVKTYYKYSKNKEIFNDKYKLLNGEASVKDVMNYVEKYLNSKEFVWHNDNKYEVYAIDVIKLSNEKYVMYCKIRRNYNGMLTDYNNGGLDCSDEKSLMSRYRPETVNMLMIGNDKVSSIHIGIDNDNIKSIENTTKCISVDTALQIISNKIGDNSSYQIHSVEMSYASFYKDENMLEYTLFPTWTIVATNKNDKKKTKFFVDIKTGEVSELVFDMSE